MREKEERQSCTEELRIKNPVLKGADHRSAPAVANFYHTYLDEQGYATAFSLYPLPFGFSQRIKPHSFVQFVLNSCNSYFPHNNHINQINQWFRHFVLTNQNQLIMGNFNHQVKRCGLQIRTSTGKRKIPGLFLTGCNRIKKWPKPEIGILQFRRKKFVYLSIQKSQNNEQY